MARLTSTAFQLQVLRRRVKKLSGTADTLLDIVDMLAENTGIIQEATQKPNAGVMALIERRAAKLQKAGKTVEALLLLRRHGG